ncbi:MAG: hypothetical protein SOR59_05640 [Lachnospiraceae bacterium]|nr:hypothetical protein [Lachnospiraceae bacterium]
MKGYKVFNPDWTCRGYQFEVGKTFTEYVTPVCYERGFHFCTKATDCFTYYAFTPNNKVAEVEALGDIDTDLYGSRCSTNKIHIIREITWYEVLNLVNYGKACTGFCNSGDYNSGNFNSGDWNMAHFSNGCFNTESPKIFLFNKPSDWTYQDWLSSSARLIMTGCPSNILIYAQEWWDSLTKKKKDIVMSLPNFDKYIFRKITGINVNKFVGKKG